MGSCQVNKCTCGFCRIRHEFLGVAHINHNSYHHYSNKSASQSQLLQGLACLFWLANQDLEINIIHCPREELVNITGPVRVWEDRTIHYARLWKQLRTIDWTRIWKKWEYLTLFNSPLLSSVLALRVDDWLTWYEPGTCFCIKSVRYARTNLWMSPSGQAEVATFAL